MTPIKVGVGELTPGTGVRVGVGEAMLTGVDVLVGAGVLVGGACVAVRVLVGGAGVLVGAAVLVGTGWSDESPGKVSAVISCKLEYPSPSLSAAWIKSKAARFRPLDL
jgi:hypothetical protein